MKTKRQIILETSKKYTSKNRSTVKNSSYLAGEGCVYKDAQGNKCAVGRCLKSNSTIFSTMNVDFGADDIGGVKLNKELKPSYRGHSVIFWADLQKFHDEKDNWDDKGLTALGDEHLDCLLKKWGKR